MCGQEKTMQTCKQFVQEKKRKQASLESSINKKQKMSQIMELHTCKKDYAPWSMILSICSSYT
jgi:hypothetical protein